jgi:hypothetical protein
MDNKKHIKDQIQSVIRLLMDNVMNKVLIEDPFFSEEHRAKKPLYAALVPDEIFKGSHFERRFVTPFCNVWEKLAEVAASAGLGFGKTQHKIDGIVNSERLRRISEILNRLEHSSGRGDRIKPDWDNEIRYILDGKSDKKIPTTIICDFFAMDLRGNRKLSFELKAPLPNSDQTKVSKEKLLKLYSMEPMQVNEAYYALPYNPYGKRENYNWSFPARWFDMKHDKVVLIGNEFWGNNRWCWNL